MLSGGSLYFVAVLLTAWFALLCRTAWRLLRPAPSDNRRTTRTQLTIGGIVFAAVAVGALLFLYLSLISPTVSQRLGTTAVRIFAFLLFWPTLAGLILSLVGAGRARFLGIGTCLATGLWWFTLFVGAAISMGSVTARHPTIFLVPKGYVGWVEVKYGVQGTPPLNENKGAYTCRIPESGSFSTSSALETGWAKDQYFYYSEDGSVQPLKATGWGAGGMIWADRAEQTSDGSKPARVAEYFYVGTEEQYHNAVSANEGRPFHEARRDKSGP